MTKREMVRIGIDCFCAAFFVVGAINSVIQGNHQKPVVNSEQQQKEDAERWDWILKCAGYTTQQNYGYYPINIHSCSDAYDKFRHE